ncbi:MAG: Fe-S protein assembly co-chaperone HscB [Porticoccaceae bacterium]
MFELPVSYEVDLRLLNERYLKLQQQLHPDHFAGSSGAEQRLAVQYTADLNQAYSVLKSPLARAQYLLELKGIDSSGNTTVTSDMDFLMQQMELREALSEVEQAEDPFQALSVIDQQVNDHFDRLQVVFADSYQQADYESARETVARLQFYSKLLAEIEQREHDLDDC